MVNDIQYVSPLGKSDHVCLVFNTNMYASRKHKHQDMHITGEIMKILMKI